MVKHERLDAVAVGAAHAVGVGDPQAAEGQRRGEPLVEHRELPRVEAGGEDRVEHVLVGVEERVAALVSPPVGALEVDDRLQALEQLEQLPPIPGPRATRPLET